MSSHISTRGPCESRGPDNWLVLGCQMAEEGIIANSSCCHGVQVGGVKGRGVLFFVNGPLASLDPPSLLPTTTPPLFLPHTPILPAPRFKTVGCFCGEGMGTQEPGSKRVTFQHLALAASLLLLSLCLDPPFLYSTPALLRSLAFVPNPPTSSPQALHTSLPPWPALLCPAAYFSAHPLYFRASFSLRSIT